MPLLIVPHTHLRVCVRECAAQVWRAPLHDAAFADGIVEVFGGVRGALMAFVLGVGGWCWGWVV